MTFRWEDAETRLHSSTLLLSKTSPKAASTLASCECFYKHKYSPFSSFLTVFLCIWPKTVIIRNELKFLTQSICICKYEYIKQYQQYYKERYKFYLPIHQILKLVLKVKIQNLDNFAWTNDHKYYLYQDSIVANALNGNSVKVEKASISCGKWNTLRN